MTWRVRSALIVLTLGAVQAVAAASMEPDIRSVRFRTSDGVRLHVLEACPPGVRPGGDAPVIAFVPGWSLPAAIWRGQLAALGATHCVAALDPRGQGESDVPQAGFEIGRRAEDLGEFVARYRRVVLVGWSLAALEALEYVHRHGEGALEGLVLVDSSVGEDPQPPSSGGFLEALRKDRPAVVADFVRACFNTPRPEAELAALTEAALRMPLEASLSLFPGAAVPRAHWRGIARGFSKPLVYAVTPQFAGQAQSLRQHRPETRVELFEGAGHALFVDEPARFNAMLSEFVEGLAPPPWPE